MLLAGLTPKLRDVPTLVEMLDYQPSTAEERKFKPKEASLPNGLDLKNYITEIPDFLVQKISSSGDNKNSNSESSLENVVDSECIYLCTQGSCDLESPNDSSTDMARYENFDKVKKMTRGTVGFTPRNYGKVKITNWSDDLVLWRASNNFYKN